MSFLINTNTTAANAAYNLGVNSTNEQMDITNLSSGLKINSAADNAAGYVVSTSMKAQDAGLTQATQNTNNAINEVKTADSALDQVTSLLTNIRSLVLDAANVGANDATAAKADQQSIAQAVASIQRISQTTQFNNNNLLKGDGAGSGTAANGALSLIFQIGANGGQTVTVGISDMSIFSLGSSTSTFVGADGTSSSISGYSLSSLGSSTGTPALNVASSTDSTGQNAQMALAIVDQAISDVATQQASLGSIQTNELQTNISSLSAAQTNTESSLSTIEDVNLATTVVDYTKNSILVQAGTSALSYANQAPQSVLKLLQ